MESNLLNIGYGNIVSIKRIIAVVSPESAPIKRLIQDAKEDKRLIDVTYGRKTRAVIVMDTSQIILSAVQPDTIANRVNQE